MMDVSEHSTQDIHHGYTRELRSHITGILLSQHELVLVITI